MEHSFMWLVLFGSFISCGIYSVRTQKSDPDESNETGYSYQFYQHEQVIDPHNSEYSLRGGNFFCLYLGLCTVGNGALGAKPSFNIKYQWKQLEYDYASDAARNAAIADGTFIPGAPLPIDVDVYYGQNSRKIFIAAPRSQAGVPASVNVVTNKMRDGNPIVSPYPNWSWYENPRMCKKDRIISAYRVQVDECGRVWILDNGRFIDQNICPAQILAFDLNTNQLVHRYEIPTNFLESRSILVTPIVDIRDSCQNAFVYVADCQTYSIIVHDVAQGTGWRITDKTMYPYPNYGTFTIEGESFELMDGVLGMALEPYQPGKDRKLFYHSLSSPTENWVYTSFLMNRTRFDDYPNSSPEIFNTYSGTRSSQSAAEAIDRNGIQYFGLASETSINCWNTRTEYGGNNIHLVEYNRNTLQFTSGLKVITNKQKQDEQELWIMTNRLQKAFTGTQNPNEVNFRLQAARVEDIVATTGCRSKGGRPHRSQSGMSSQRSSYRNKRDEYHIEFPNEK